MLRECRQMFLDILELISDCANSKTDSFYPRASAFVISRDMGELTAISTDISRAVPEANIFKERRAILRRH